MTRAEKRRAALEAKLGLCIAAAIVTGQRAGLTSFTDLAQRVAEYVLSEFDVKPKPRSTPHL